MFAFLFVHRRVPMGGMMGGVVGRCGGIFWGIFPGVGHIYGGVRNCCLVGLWGFWVCYL